MRIGVNWISPTSLSMIQQLIRAGEVECCEIMVDNFAHLPAQKIREALLDVPICLHIVTSRFLEKSASELQVLAALLQPWIRELQPLYVSDHLVQFTDETGRWLPMITELEYDRLHAHVCQRVNDWQTLLDIKIFFENHASLTEAGKYQADFFADLIRTTHCGLLFDFSNAYIAERNQICDFKSWDTLIRQTNYFHVGGFRVDEKTHLLLDTHDQAVAEDVITLIRQYLPNRGVNTLILEYDANVTLNDWQQDTARLRAAIC